VSDRFQHREVVWHVAEGGSVGRIDT